MKLTQVLFPVALVLGGCQSLLSIGAGGDRKTMATVKGIVQIAGLNLGYDGVTRFDITAVDSNRRGFFSTSKVMLPPGTHSIEVTTESMVASGMTCYLTFSAEAGKVYLLRPRYINGALGAVVVDEETRRVIASDP